MIAVTFPDGASRQFEPGVSGVDIAKSISPSLAKRSVAMTLDGASSISPARSIATPKSNSSRATIRARWS